MKIIHTPQFSNPDFSQSGIDFEFVQGDNTLSIRFERVQDLFISVNDGVQMKKDEIKSILFDIHSEDEIYPLFDKLYNEIINKDPYGRGKSEDEVFFPNYSELVNSNGVITWVSDDGIPEEMDTMEIMKTDESYRLVFTRNANHLSFGFKDPLSIGVRIANSGSKYEPFNLVFMRLYQGLNEFVKKPSDIVRRRFIKDKC